MSEKRYINVMSKISPTAAERLEKIRMRAGFKSKYEILQYLIAAFLKHADPGGEPDRTDTLSPELARMFEDYEDAGMRTFARPDGDMQRGRLAYVMAFFEHRSKGPHMRLVKVLDSQANISTSTNSHTAVEVALGELFPEQTRKLRAIQRQLRLPTLLEAIDVACDCFGARRVDAITEETEAEFAGLADADPRRVELGEENRYKRARSYNGGY